MTQLSLDPGPWLAHVLLILLVGVFVMWAGKRAGVSHQTGVALCLHFVVGVSIYATSGLWAPDAMHYDRLGIAFMEYWSGENHQEPWVTAGKEGIPYLLAILYQMLGHYPFLGVIINIGLASLVVPITASTSRILKIDPSMTAWLAACLPPMLLWGSVLLREAPSWLFLALIVRGLVGVSTGGGRSWLNWLCIVVPIGPLFLVRGTAAVLVGAAALFTITLMAKNRFLPILVGGLGLVAAAPLLTTVINEVAGGYDVEAINRQRGALARSADSSFEVEEYGSLGEMILRAPFSLVRGIAGPFPWELPPLGIFLIFDTLVWWVVVILTILGIRHYGERRRLWSLLVPGLTMLMVLSITSGNYGTMTRLRYQVAVMLLPLAGHGLAHVMKDSRVQKLIASWTRQSRIQRPRQIAASSKRLNGNGQSFSEGNTSRGTTRAVVLGQEKDQRYGHDRGDRSR